MSEARTSFSPLGLGCGPLGSLNAQLETQADATLAAAWSCGVRFFDTAPWYGLGTSELRLGRFLRTQDRSAYTVSTKVGRLVERPRDPKHFRPDPTIRPALPFEWRFAYDYDGVLRSFEDSLHRLGLNRIDLVLIHDVDAGVHGSADAAAARITELDKGGGFRALLELHDHGAIDAIGAGLNQSESVAPLLARFDLNVCLLAGRYTLLEQGALDEALPLCEANGVSVVAGAPFNSGILAAEEPEQGTYDGENAPASVVEHVRALGRVCSHHRVELAAAALQFPLAHPAIVSVIPGAVTPEEVRENAARCIQSIPQSLWSDLKDAGLLRADARTPSEASS